MRSRRLSSPLVLALLVVLALAGAYLYMTTDIDPRHVDYAIKLRTPKLLAMVIAGASIGAAAMAFQAIVNNHIITPSLLGMNSLYSLTHTAVFFFAGSTSYWAANKQAAFLLDLGLMSILSTIIYGYLFAKTKFNVLYILLAGTVFGQLCSSITNTLIKGMDPNEFAGLQNKLIASFSRANTELLFISAVVLVVVTILILGDVAKLNVITLGRNQAIALGVSYDWTITKLLMGIAMYMSVATALVGPISFLGLVVANVTRYLFKTYRHGYLLTGSALLGMIMLLAGQTAIEHVLGFHTTIAVVINIVGGLYFLLLVATTSRKR